MKTRVEQAEETFGAGFSCAQSVVSAFSEKYGMDREQALKVSGGMGGGFRSGEICGAIAAGALVVGLKYGPNKEGDTDSKKACDAKTKEYINAFKVKTSSITCRDIMKCDMTTEEGLKQSKERNLRKTVCAEMVKSAVSILEELGY